MAVRSQILLSETVDNLNPKFGASRRYIPVYVRIAGVWVHCHLTRDQIDVGVARAKQNREDMPPRARWYHRIAGWFLGKF